MSDNNLEKPKWSQVIDEEKIRMLIQYVLGRRIYPSRDIFYLETIGPHTRAAYWYQGMWYLYTWSLDGGVHDKPFDPLHNMDDAWQLLTSEKVFGANMSYGAAYDMLANDFKGASKSWWMCSIYWREQDQSVHTTSATAHTMQEAICKVMLKSLGSGLSGIVIDE